MTGTKPRRIRFVRDNDTDEAVEEVVETVVKVAPEIARLVNLVRSQETEIADLGDALADLTPPSGVNATYQERVLALDLARRVDASWFTFEHAVAAVRALRHLDPLAPVTLALP